jgi:hypothetical protein
MNPKRSVIGMATIRVEIPFETDAETPKAMLSDFKEVWRGLHLADDLSGVRVVCVDPCPDTVFLLAVEDGERYMTLDLETGEIDFPDEEDEYGEW